MVGQTYLEAALSAYIFEYLVAASVTRNGENMTVPCQPLVLFDDTLGNVQRRMFDSVLVFFLRVIYPQVAVEECLQAVDGEVLHVPQPWGNVNCLISPSTVIRPIKGRLPFGFEVVFRWLCPIEKQSVTNALSANSLRFTQIYFFAMCLF